MSAVIVKSFAAPQVNRKEILRYAGVKGNNRQTENLLDDCLAKCDGIFEYKVCYVETDIKIFGTEVDFGFAKTNSALLAKNLEGCKRAIVFAATIGLNIDRHIKRFSNLSPSAALMFQAIGAERIEAVCDVFCREKAKELISEHKFLRPRFSAGYGDFVLDFQKEIFRILDPAKHIGIFLNESLIMTPSKSVTAVVGITDNKCENVTACNACRDKTCEFRREECK